VSLARSASPSFPTPVVVVVVLVVVVVVVGLVPIWLKAS